MAVTEAAQRTTVHGRFLDRGTFVPIRTRVTSLRMDGGPPGDGVVCGEGTVDGRRVFWFEQDPTVLGGSLGEAHAGSICRILDLAGRWGAPVVGVHRSGGARIQEGVAALAGYARIFARHVALRDKVPQLALVFGPCAGGAAYGPALMDFVLMSRTGAYMFLTGPDVAREVTGEEVTFDELGGVRVASRSGLASLVGEDEDGTLEAARRLLAYLPQRIGAARVTGGWSPPCADPGRHVPSDPKATYDVRDVVRGAGHA